MLTTNPAKKLLHSREPPIFYIVEDHRVCWAYPLLEFDCLACSNKLLKTSVALVASDSRFDR